jgi:hypothetical protein
MPILILVVGALQLATAARGWTAVAAHHALRRFEWPYGCPDLFSMRTREGAAERAQARAAEWIAANGPWWGQSRSAAPMPSGIRMASGPIIGPNGVTVGAAAMFLDEDFLPTVCPAAEGPITAAAFGAACLALAIAAGFEGSRRMIVIAWVRWFVGRIPAVARPITAAAVGRFLFRYLSRLAILWIPWAVVRVTAHGLAPLGYVEGPLAVLPLAAFVGGAVSLTIAGRIDLGEREP